MKYVQFFHNGTDGKPRPMCGSDGVMLVDQRHADHRIADQALHHARKLNAGLGKGIVGYAIIKGSLRDPVRDDHPFHPV